EADPDDLGYERPLELLAESATCAVRVPGPEHQRGRAELEERGGVSRAGLLEARTEIGGGLACASRTEGHTPHVVVLLRFHLAGEEERVEDPVRRLERGDLADRGGSGSPEVDLDQRELELARTVRLEQRVLQPVGLGLDRVQ